MAWCKHVEKVKLWKHVLQGVVQAVWTEDTCTLGINNIRVKDDLLKSYFASRAGWHLHNIFILRAKCVASLLRQEIHDKCIGGFICEYSDFFSFFFSKHFSNRYINVVIKYKKCWHTIGEINKTYLLWILSMLNKI